ncbi:NAD(P)-binding domain-containing protein [Candidatus Woesearchaeota archaeon]|jgi:6-phosphogluconate dehydrogenase|nr:NAD(P)-binding domain-containing protein [Candidatus Woesearchaeota archaeon]
MKIGFIGLGRMGFNMSLRLMQHDHQVVGFDVDSSTVKKLEEKGAESAYSINELVNKLDINKSDDKKTDDNNQKNDNQKIGEKEFNNQKIVWLMLPAGKITEDAMKEVLKFLDAGDIIINGANSFYQNAEKHDAWCKEKGVHFFDVGVSGGVWGLKRGYPLMIGGPKDQYEFIEPLMKSLSTDKGYKYFGPAGSGHFVKSVHNIIEYTYLQGLAEGVELLSKFKHKIKLDEATEGWQDSSVIRSWLLDLTTIALRREDFKEISSDIGSVTINELEATKKAVNGYAPAFDEAVKVRKSQDGKFILGKRVISAVRNEFGGHAVKKKE